MSALEKNPELIQKCSNETIRNLSGQLGQIVSSINGPMMQIHQMLSQLIYKPSVKGAVGEKALAELWSRDFTKDLIEMLGGAGREDFLVTPYLNTGINRLGDRISVERKSGKQKYTGAHLDEAVRHSMHHELRIPKRAFLNFFFIPFVRQYGSQCHLIFSSPCQCNCHLK